MTPTWIQTQFDKLLMVFLILILCGLSLVANDKLTAFALVGAGNCMGCLLTLVVARRNPGPEPLTK